MNVSRSRTNERAAKIGWITGGAIVADESRMTVHIIECENKGSDEGNRDQNAKYVGLVAMSSSAVAADGCGSVAMFMSSRDLEMDRGSLGPIPAP